MKSLLFFPNSLFSLLFFSGFYVLRFNTKLSSKIVSNEMNLQNNWIIYKQLNRAFKMWWNENNYFATKYCIFIFIVFVKNRTCILLEFLLIFKLDFIFKFSVKGAIECIDTIF